MHNRPRIVIAGTQSGVGKTTIVTGLLRALSDQGRAVQPFKIGPDYIDPGFHEKAARCPSYNLDTWLVPAERLPANFSLLSAKADVSIIEGVMGLYDGGVQGVSSTADIAKRLHAPVILVLNVQSMGQSAGALALGFRDYDPDIHIAGVILNRVGSSRHAEMTKVAIEELGIPVLGILHRNETLQTPERHLGLTPVTELENSTEARIVAMANSVKESVELDRLYDIAQSAPSLQVLTNKKWEKRIPVRVAIARDEAFSFYYPTGLHFLEELGAELIPFSPLHDENLPQADGVIFGGGFPEMFLEKLSNNQAMCEDIRKKASAGMPIYAECGGLMYLCRQIIDFTGKAFQTVGVVPAITQMEKKLQRVGYVTATALSDSILAIKGDQLRGHEFHFSTMKPDDPEHFPWAYELQGTRQQSTHREGYVCGRVLASYLHLTFDGNEEATWRFLRQCQNYRKEQS